ncbi:MAG: hypothetical protein HY308_02665 [Gammaproteobacteria bacterium]|nr:hypothetical protein [Gammaproteobacteria bacterium]
MKRFMFTYVITVLLFGSGYLSVPLATAATTGQVTITGNVPIACDLLVQQETGADNIPDISAGHSNRHVATVTETCNSPDGYTVTLTASNSGDHTGMFVDVISTDSHPFTINYNGISVPPGGLVTDSTLPAFGVQKNVAITYPADETLTGTVTNTYDETLIFTISAK